MNYKNLLTALGFSQKENVCDAFAKKYPQADSYCLEVDFEKNTIDYGNLIQLDSKTTQNFSQPESFVVLECVNRLLEKGYKPQNIILEKTWAAGHGASGRLDICVARDNGDEYLLIECKTYGKEFDKEFARMKKDGGQLFTYFKFSNKADLIMLYASELKGKEIVYRNEIVKIENDYRNGDVKDFYERWNKLTKDNGVFEAWVQPYNFESKALTPKQLKPIRQDDSSFIFNSFLEILRHNVVSDKPNAFNKIFTLFLCKVYDEKTTKQNEELKFQWLEGKDDDVSFQIRLTNLYKDGMRDFLEKEVTDFSETDFDTEYNYLDEKTKQSLLSKINKLRLEKNNEFAIKEVYDGKSFKENAKIVKEVVELLQTFRLRYNKRQQYLSDFFELLLTTGLKQESGQFFTPVPIAQFIIKSLPVDVFVDKKLEKGETNNLLPFLIDYAAGSGHFLTESMHEIQRLIDKKNAGRYIDSTARKIKGWQTDHFDWATQYIYGIEKDYRLVKVGKVGCYLHGDGLANVTLSDGLANFENTKEYKDLLKRTDKDFPKENRQFDILVSNPPYSVSAFRNTAREYYTGKDFELYDSLTDSSSEIECLFVERMKQLLKDGGVAGVILPSSILSNEGIYAKTREIILQYFEIIAITELGSNTFMATGTNTVVLFLRRRNNYDSINLWKSIARFLSDYQDVARNGIEKPVAKYVNHVWENITFDDYVTMLKQNPNNAVTNHEIYREYRKKINAKTEKEFWSTLIETEKEKLFYFVLAHPQKVVLVKTGEKEAEKRFLGYEFSNRRGREGIHPIQRGKTIDECTQLFDDERFDNPEKASTYIYKAFAGDYDFPIHESMKNNILHVNLVDLLTFDRDGLVKNISTMVKKKVRIESRWDSVKLEDIISLEYGKALPENKRLPGIYPVMGSNGICGYHNINLIEGPAIIIGRKGSAGKVTFIADSCYPIDTTFYVQLKKQTDLRFLYHILLQLDLENMGGGIGVPGINRNDIYEIKIPFPPLEIQQKIAAEIEALEKEEAEAKGEIEKLKAQIEQKFRELDNKANKTLRLSDADIFDTSIGKRVLSDEVTSKGIPVFSANVFVPFGFIDKYLIADFGVPSILWGIDGDWMVNFMPAQKPFYPTDHCGVLRIKKDEVLPEYLTWLLNEEGKKRGFSRTLRASIDRIQGIIVKVPPLSDQQKVVSEIGKIEAQITEAQKVVDATQALKNEALKKYL
jgi:type I restriction enzyme M protein